MYRDFTLIFDFSFPDVLSVSIANDDEIIFFCGVSGVVYGSRAIASTVDMCMNVCGVRPDELKKVVLTRGPGSFTALRCSIAYAKGLSAVLSIPVEVYGSFDWMPLYLLSTGKICENEKVAIISETGVRGAIYLAKYIFRGSTPSAEEIRIVSESEVSSLGCKVFDVKEVPRELGAKFLFELTKTRRGILFPPEKVDELEPLYLFPENFRKLSGPSFLIDF